MYSRKAHKGLYSKYNAMKARCCRKTSGKYKNYGARGISICAEWLDPVSGFDTFAEWALSHGYADGMTIERIDVNGNYCPENCAWVCMSEQAYNKTNTVWVNYMGKRVQLAKLCKQLGLNYQSVYYRIHEGGMSVEDALTLPRQNVTDLFLKSRERGINPKIVKDRVYKLGWDVERALTTPPRKMHRRTDNLSSKNT